MGVDSEIDDEECSYHRCLLSGMKRNWHLEAVPFGF